MKSYVRKHLHLPGLLKRIRSQYEKIIDPLIGKTAYTLVDCLMSGIALFGLKYPSLLQFDKKTHGCVRVKHNIKALYGVKDVPSDTYFRERLDEVNPLLLQRGINRLIAQLQRGKVLETYRYWDNYLLVAIDGTGYFSSHEVHCDNCCQKRHRNGTTTYYHQMLSAVIVHPTYRTVFPLMLEPIIKSDGMKKNDCEHNALKRLLVKLRKAHPHLPMVVTLDGLYADGIIIKLLQSLDIRFIITAHEKDLPYLYEFYQAAIKQRDSQQQGNVHHQFEWCNGLPLNDTHSDCEVNLLRHQEMVHRKGRPFQQQFAWVTDLLINSNRVSTIMKGGRARWRVENETFNTLKNQGYQFEHNFGHGYKSLSVVMAYLMFTAFLIDQIQEFACKYFQAALKKQGRLNYLWEMIRCYFLTYLIDSWEQIYTAISDALGAKLGHLIQADTS